MTFKEYVRRIQVVDPTEIAGHLKNIFEQDVRTIWSSDWLISNPRLRVIVRLSFAVNVSWPINFEMTSDLEFEAYVDCTGQRNSVLGFEINQSEPHIVLKSCSKIFFNDPRVCRVNNLYPYIVLRSTVQVKQPMTGNLEFEISQSEPRIDL